MALSTPLYDLSLYPDVYDPSEDTHLFLDALEQEANAISVRQPLTACEVGSGSGVLITALATILGTSCTYFSTDVNLSACQATRNTAILNQVQIESVRMNLLDMFKHQFDLILFNPPYVVTDENEVCGHGLNRAYAGGGSGRTIIDRFLKQLPKVLSPKGVCYLLLLKENRVDEVQKVLHNKGMHTEVVLSRRVPGEFLYVIKITRT